MYVRRFTRLPFLQDDSSVLLEPTSLYKISLVENFVMYSNLAEIKR